MKKIMYITLGSILIQLNIQAQTYNPRYRNTESTEEQVVSKPMNLIQVTTPDVPKTFSLFGEKMPLELWDVRERFDRELLVNTFMQGSTSYIIKLMNRWLPMIENRLAANGVPDDF